MASQKNITVYVDYVSPPARSILLALKLHKAEHLVNIEFVSLAEKKQLEADFVAMNPWHTVPVLKDTSNNVILFESAVILQYLAEVFQWTGDYGYPQELGAKYKVANAMQNHLCKLNPAIGEVMTPIYATLFAGIPFSKETVDAKVEKLKKTIFPTLTVLIEKNGGYLAGAQPSLADLQAAVALFPLSTYNAEVTMGLINLEEIPVLDTWFKTVIVAIRHDDIHDNILPFIQYAKDKIGGY